MKALAFNHRTDILPDSARSFKSDKGEQFNLRNIQNDYHCTPSSTPSQFWGAGFKPEKKATWRAG